jgi:hypothetical protein
MSLILGLDIDEIIKNKIDIAGKKYPANLMKRRSVGEGFAIEEYLKIKKESRKGRSK